MKAYRVDPEDFFSMLPDTDLRNYWSRTSKLCEKPMTELIYRYGLRAKKVLSVGAAYGHEEYWFHKNGCKLTLVDIDEKKSIGNYLEYVGSETSKSKKDADGSKLLTYFISDANDYVASNKEQFDVCYFSSFTPNELRNADVYAKIPKSFASRALRRFSSQRSVGWSWPEDVEPLLDLVIEVLKSALAHGGVFIYQSYASGVDVRTKRYLPMIKNQLDAIGITLVDTYFFVKYPAVHLVVGFRGNYRETVRWAEEIRRKNPELTAFHGRSHDQIEFKGVSKIYDILRSS